MEALRVGAFGPAAVTFNARWILVKPRMIEQPRGRRSTEEERVRSS